MDVEINLDWEKQGTNRKQMGSSNTVFFVFKQVLLNGFPITNDSPIKALLTQEIIIIKSNYTSHDSQLGDHPGQGNINFRSRNVGFTIMRHTHLPPLPFFCRSSSPSIRRLSISSISLIDSRMSSANLQRSWSLRALNVIRVQLSTRCDSLIPNE